MDPKADPKGYFFSRKHSNIEQQQRNMSNVFFGRKNCLYARLLAKILVSQVFLDLIKNPVYLKTLLQFQRLFFRCSSALFKVILSCSTYVNRALNLGIIFRKKSSIEISLTLCHIYSSDVQVSIKNQISALDAVGSSQIFFPTQNLARTY